MKPEFRTLAHRNHELGDVFTINIPVRGATSADLKTGKPGQFNMLYAFGVGEIPISMSGDPGATDRIVHTIRAVGPVSEALSRLKPGDSIGVRGPFGSSWPIAQAEGSDVLIIAGGIGLAPLRPAIYHLMRERAQYGRVALLYGARTPNDLLYRREIDEWRRTPDLQVRVTVDRAGADWAGDVGVVTSQLAKVRFDPRETVAFVCGPEIMIRMTGVALRDAGVDAERIFVSMERNMKCAVGLCGHCQFGPHFVCRDGPVFGLDQIGDMLCVREI